MVNGENPSCPSVRLDPILTANELPRPPSRDLPPLCLLGSLTGRNPAVRTAFAQSCLLGAGAGEEAAAAAPQSSGEPATPPRVTPGNEFVSGVFWRYFEVLFCPRCLQGGRPMRGWRDGAGGTASTTCWNTLITQKAALTPGEASPAASCTHTPSGGNFPELLCRFCFACAEIKSILSSCSMRHCRKTRAVESGSVSANAG